MHLYKVGEPYVAGVASLPERGEYNFRAGQHELVLCLPNLTEAEIRDVQKGQAEFALVTYPEVIFFLYRFGDAVTWSDAPYCWHRVPVEQRQLPPASGNPEARALLQVVLVDAASNRIRALRALTLSPQFTRMLEAAIAVQATNPARPGDYEARIDAVCRLYPNSAALLEVAVDRCRGGE